MFAVLLLLSNDVNQEYLQEARGRFLYLPYTFHCCVSSALNVFSKQNKINGIFCKDGENSKQGPLLAGGPGVKGRDLPGPRSCEWQGLTSWGPFRPRHLCAHCC